MIFGRGLFMFANRTHGDTTVYCDYRWQIRKMLEHGIADGCTVAFIKLV